MVDTPPPSPRGAPGRTADAVAALLPLLQQGKGKGGSQPDGPKGYKGYKGYKGGW